ncbi:MAG: hypothetical protein ABII21_00765 [bacterium]
MYERYVAASKEIQRLHNGRKAGRNDADLVRPGAAKHGVRVVEGGIFFPMSLGNYNPRLPVESDKEAEKVEAARRLVVVCEDYRQSGDVINDPEIGYEEGDIVFATAGGPVQPDSERLNADVEWINAVIELNPGIAVIFVHHLRVCGGANYFTHQEMERIFADGAGAEAEAFEMERRAAIMPSMIDSSSAQYVALLDEDDEYLVE